MKAVIFTKMLWLTNEREQRQATGKAEGVQRRGYASCRAHAFCIDEWKSLKTGGLDKRHVSPPYRLLIEDVLMIWYTHLLIITVTVCSMSLLCTSFLKFFCKGAYYGVYTFTVQ